MAYDFHAIRRRSKVAREGVEPAQPGVPAPEAAGPTDDVKSGTQKVVGNLLSHVPTEAVALATSLSPFTADNAPPARSWVILVGSLLLMCVVRYVNRASRNVWITSVLAFMLWMALTPNSVLGSLYASRGLDQVTVLMIATVFSAIVTVLTSAGRIK